MRLEKIEALVDAWCEAWSNTTGRTDFVALAQFYSTDPKIVMFDTLPPFEGSTGFSAMAEAIYPDVNYTKIKRVGPIGTRWLGDRDNPLVWSTFHIVYGFADSRGFEFDARISQVWERVGQDLRIVHEHPSTPVLPPV